MEKNPLWHSRRSTGPGSFVAPRPHRLRRKQERKLVWLLRKNGDNLELQQLEWREELRFKQRR